MRGHTIASDRTPNLEISVLGPLRAWSDDGEHAVGGRRQRSVLARLAIAGGEVVGAERVIDDLWDGEPPRSATNTLQSYVSNLRRTLDHDASVVVERVGDGYRIDPAGAELTAVRFERLVAEGSASGPPASRLAALDAALGLWRGPALGDLADEPWARGPAVRLEELRLAATEARFDLQLQAGRHAVIVGDLEAEATAHPLRERLTAQLVLALYRSGRQAEALRAYDRARAHLADELGLDPSPDLARLAGQVLDQAPELDHVPVADGPTPVSVRPGGGDAPVSVPEGLLPLPPAVEGRRALSRFVGRHEELARLGGAWSAAVEGSRHLALVAAEPGAGKTRLAQEMALRVHAEGGQVLWGRCTPESLAPYQPVVEALRTATEAMGREATQAMVAARPALGRLLPEASPEAADEARRSDLLALYDALSELGTEVSAGAAILLVVDDAQWADTATLSLLDHLLADGRGGRLLVLATVRRPAGRATPELDAFVAGQRRADRLTEVVLPGLAPSEVGELLGGRGVTVDPATAAALRDRTGGNPFFLEALADHGGDLTGSDARALPTSVRDVLDGRLADLEPEAAAVLTAAAIIGQRIDLALLGTVTRTDPDALLDVVDAAVAGGLLAEDEDLGWVTFPHALVRQALVARTTRNREAHLHRRVADVLEAAGTAPAGAVAEHLLAAGRLVPLARRARAALDAAEEAVAVLADNEADRWVGRALAALDVEPAAETRLRAEALTLAARVARHLARRERGEEAIREAVAVARRAGDPVLLARAAQEQALMEGGVGLAYGAVDEDLIALLEEALAALPPGHEQDRAALLGWLSIARDGTDPERQADMAAEALARAEAQPGQDHLRALALLARRIAVAGPDGLDERLRLGPQMDEAARGWREMEVMSLVLDVTGLVEADRVPEARAALERLRALVADHDRPGYRAYLLFLDATFALLRGDLDAGEALSNEALGVGADAHGTNAVLMWSAQQVNLARERGTLADLAPIAVERVAEFPRIQAWRAALSAARAAQGDHAGAAEAYGPLFTAGAWASRGDTSLWYVTTYLVAESAAGGADAVACAALAEALGPLEGRMAITGMGSGALGPLDRVRGLVREVVGDVDGAVSALTSAVDRATAAGFTPWEGRARADRARLLRRRDGPGDAEQAAADLGRARRVRADLGIRLALDPTQEPDDG
ncbi:AAA family ATPase [Iamia sp. SCSIO 61187]|uniref:AfsR/SARP family transcriptional regulator n=1 Tax=Iamia sp. SCSIO 61187 TaxID=2722752 RepID=UPI001C63524E|nr:AfsR/SARP family transcriptional regulator [Iamia sp. SCSIO 61187]QYG91955.1 AAA family ATPase [Iamia sp. SCSIO 61187]